MPGAVPGPHQRHGLGEIAHEIVGPAEQHRVEPAFRDRADHAGLGELEAELARQRREPPAAIGIGLVGEEPAQQRDLGEPPRGERQELEQFGEDDHPVAPGSPAQPFGESGAPSLPGGIPGGGSYGLGGAG